MIEINLLPTVKKDYLKAQQMKHTVIIAAVLTSIVAVVLLVLVFAYVQVVQPQHQKNVQEDIDSGVKALQEKNDAVKIVTVQGALEQLSPLQDKKKISSNIFGYLTEFTPKGVTYGNIKLNMTDGTLGLQGSATSLEQANILANNLKSAKFTYTKDDSTQTLTPFSEVIFEGLSKSDQATTAKNVSFQINFKVDPLLFDQSIKGGKITVNASSEQLLLQSDKPFQEGAQ
ncbi:hypothetical protein KBD20_00190 [Candidatus Saccharibacteria bacterium]|nr:hypothetical protein [Candidatus Saccharibacteria bacterium]